MQKGIDERKPYQMYKETAIQSNTAEKKLNATGAWPE